MHKSKKEREDHCIILSLYSIHVCLILYLPLEVTQCLGEHVVSLALQNLTRSQWTLELQIHFSISQQESFVAVRLERNAANLMCCFASTQLTVETVLENGQAWEISVI